MNCIENEKCTIYVKVNDNCRIGGFSKPEFKNYIDLIHILNESYYKFRRLYRTKSSPFKSGWINFVNNEHWTLKESFIDTATHSRHELYNEKIRIIIDSDDPTLSTKLCLYLADNLDNLKEAIDKIRDLLVRFTVGENMVQ